MTSSNSRTRPLKIAVIGAGASGLMVMIRLREAGHDVVGFEKASDIGGTWRDNRYPGIGCDVPSLAYRYSFAPNTTWSRVCAPGHEILNYFKDVTEERDLRSIIRFDEEITGARFRDGRWELETSRADRVVVDAVITAVGVLHHPVIPTFQGADTFLGHAFHSSRWPDDLDLAGKRIGIIGTGSTATQIISATVETAREVVLFQRTAQWVLPVPNPMFTQEESRLQREDPEYLRQEYDRLNDDATGKFAAAVVGENPSAYRNMVRLCAEYLDTVRDPELRAKLTPNYPVGCKRLIMSDTFYEAVQQPNARVVVDGIDEFTPEGIKTADGTIHPLDIIVYATGFDPHRYFRPMRIIGENGLDLNESWAEENMSYLGVATPGFPNWFMIGGPLSPIGNFSWLLTAEAQFAYIAQLLELLASGGAKSIAPTQAATDAFLDAVRATIPNTVWAKGCHSWYINDKGKVASYPWTYGKFLNDMQAPDLSDYALA